MKKLILSILFAILVMHANSQTTVKLALPDNCNATSSTGVPETVKTESAKSRLEVSPNPSDGLVTLKFSSTQAIGKATVSVFDFAGKPVYEESIFVSTASWLGTLNLGRLPQGTYVLWVKNAKEQLSTKLIIK